MNITTPPRGVNFMVDNFGVFYDEKNNPVAVKRFTWRNCNEVQVQVITYGAIVTSVKCPDKSGNVEDVVLGFDELSGYIEQRKYALGGVVCECAVPLDKRQKKSMGFSRLRLDGEVDKGLDQVVWDHHVSKDKVTLSYLLDKGPFPLRILTTISFELNDENEFKVVYKAMCGQMSVLNVSHACFFNLSGHHTGYGGVRQHTVKLEANCVRFSDCASKCFKTATQLKELVDCSGLYDKIHCVNRSSRPRQTVLVATLSHKATGRQLKIYTNQQGLRFDIGSKFPKWFKRKACMQPEWSTDLERKSTRFQFLEDFYNKAKEAIALSRNETCDEVRALIQYFRKILKDSNLTTNAGNPEIFKLTAIQEVYIRTLLNALKDVKKTARLEALKKQLEALLLSNGQATYDLLTATFAQPEKIADTTDRYISGKFSAKYSKHAGISFKSMHNFEVASCLDYTKCKRKPRNSYNHTVIYKFITNCNM